MHAIHSLSVCSVWLTYIFIITVEPVWWKIVTLYLKNMVLSKFGGTYSKIQLFSLMKNIRSRTGIMPHWWINKLPWCCNKLLFYNLAPHKWIKNNKCDPKSVKVENTWCKETLSSQTFNFFCLWLPTAMTVLPWFKSVSCHYVQLVFINTEFWGKMLTQFSTWKSLGPNLAG
jgi:hypothetical protein